jgi:hypothetical protein
MMKSRRMTWTGHMARIGEERGAKIVLVGKLRERDHMEDSHRWEDNSKMYLQEVGRVAQSV